MSDLNCVFLHVHHPCVIHDILSSFLSFFCNIFIVDLFEGKDEDFLHLQTILANPKR